MDLAKIFVSEREKHWKTAFAQYRELYRQSPSAEVAIHFAFFCWYLLWQWDEISFPGETLSCYERGSADTRGGIARSGLLFHLDLTAGQLLASPESIPAKYLLVLSLMKKIYPYFFKEETFSEDRRQQLVAFLRQKPLGDPGTQAIYDYLQTQSTAGILPAGKAAAPTLFPPDSLLRSYFTWLFA